MRLTLILTIMLAAMATATLPSCSDDEPVVEIQDADPAQVREASATYNSLSFAWSKVAGVNQYGYTLADADGVTIYDGVTNGTSVSFEDLHNDAQYTFELRVYGAYGEPSYRTSIKASTLAIRQLATPQPEAKQSGNKVVVSWAAVEGAAAYEYTYSIGDNVITSVTAVPTVTITGLAPGKHLVTVTALSDYGGYTDSETAKVEAVRSRSEIATVSGTYTCGLMRRNNTWPCNMHIYDDNSYVIDSFYQGDGYNLDFYVDTDSETGESFIGVYSFVSFPDCEYYVVDTGRASVPQIDMLPGLIDGVYGSSFSGDATSGTMTVNTRYSTASGTDKFAW